MARWILLTLTLAVVAVLSETRVIPAEPISVMLDAYGNPVMFLREKRAPVAPYPQRAMMFTSYYRPVRRNAGQATGVFAQGNAVSGQAFFGGMQPHLRNGPEPIEEPEVSSAEAHAAPSGERYPDEQQEQGFHGSQQPEENQFQDHGYQGPQDPHSAQEDEASIPQDHQEPESTAGFATKVPEESLESMPVSTEASSSKGHGGKKGKKPPVVIEEDDEEDEYDEDEPVVPFVPFKGNRRRQGYPNLNNFFPMVFSFPGASSRSGNSGSPPNAVTAIANSYSTAKGGVASSVAKAYGGPSNGKKRRMPPAEE